LFDAFGDRLKVLVLFLDKYLAFGAKIPAERISRAIAAYEPTNNRSQFKKTDNNELIIV